MKRRLNKGNLKLLLISLLICLVSIGLVRGIAEGVRGTGFTAPAQSSPGASPETSSEATYNLSLPGEGGFWEYHRSIHYRGDRNLALESGYFTCKLLDLSTVLDTYNRMRFTDKASDQDAQRLLVASSTYLCPDRLPEVKDFSVHGGVSWGTVFPKGE